MTSHRSAAREEGASRVVVVTSGLAAAGIAGALAVAGIAYADHQQSTGSAVTTDSSNTSTDSSTNTDSTSPSPGTSDETPHATSGGS